jgi:hypothetical protein
MVTSDVYIFAGQVLCAARRAGARGSGGDPGVYICVCIYM